MTITEFLLARIEEDEAAAREWYGTGTVANRRDEFWLAECKSKREIIARHTPKHTYDWGECSVCEDLDNNVGQDYHETWPCRTMIALASVYADHPDYQQEWSA